MTRISNAAARRTTSRPTLPSPTTPSVLPRSSVPTNFRFSQLPALVEAQAAGMERAMESMSAMVCSAAETALPPGVFITSTPAAVAAGRSMFSIPTPARPITRSLGAWASTAASTIKPLRTMSASASARCSVYSLGFEVMISQPGCARRRLSPPGANGSAKRIRMAGPLDHRCFWRERDTGIRVLHGGDAGSEFHGEPVGGENDFELGDDGKEVGEIEIAEVRDAENLAFHGTLAVGDDGAEAIAVFLDDHAGVHSGRRFDRGYRGAWRAGREQFEAQSGGG